MAAQTNKGVHTETQKSINRKSKDKDNSSAHTLWLTSDLCKVQCRNTTAMSVEHQRRKTKKNPTKQTEPIENADLMQVRRTAYLSCYSPLHTQSRLSLQNLWLYITQRPPVILTPTLIWQMEPCAATSWSRQPLSMKDTPGESKDQLRGSDDSQWLPRPEACSKTSKQLVWSK